MLLILLLAAATLSAILYEPLGWAFIALALVTLIYKHIKEGG